MIKMDLKRVFMSLAVVSLSQGLFAQNSTWYLGMNLGGMKPRLPSAMFVNNGSNLIYPYNVDRYSTGESSALLFTAEAGRFWQRAARLLPGLALGIKYQHLFSNTIHGQIMQYSVPKFINYDYAWDVSVDTLSAYSKLELIQLGLVMPYVSGGLGVAMNHANSYRESALPGILARDYPGYGSHTQSNLAYDLGVGIDILLKPNMLASFGYSYQYLGHVQSSQGLRFPPLDIRLNTNAFFVGVAYLFDKKNDGIK